MKHIEDHGEHNNTAELRGARHARGNERMCFSLHSNRRHSRGGAWPLTVINLLNESG
jgi:hypothetical protein